jgi:hypothetical protein
MLLQNDGMLIWAATTADRAGQKSGTIELPVNLLDEQSDLFDRLFAYTFDILGLQTVELRIRQPTAEDGSASCLHARDQ